MSLAGGRLCVSVRHMKRIHCRWPGATVGCSRARVLVADDEADCVDLLRLGLTQAGYDVVTAGNGLNALHAARLCLPDLILLDLMMDGLDGFAVCDLLRRQPSTAAIPIVIVTALDGESLSDRLRLAGATDLLQKPFTTKQLMASVERALAPAAAGSGTDPNCRELPGWSPTASAAPSFVG